MSGLSCMDLVFFTSIISSRMVGSLFPSQSFAHSDSSTLVLDHASLDPLIVPRKMAHLDVTTRIFDTSRVEKLHFSSLLLDNLNLAVFSDILRSSESQMPNGYVSKLGDLQIYCQLCILVLGGSSQLVSD